MDTIANMQKIQSVAESGERSLRTDYSGRGMFGSTCWGIVCDDPNDVIAEVGIKGAKTDSMGTSTIVYWPSIRSLSFDHD
jgi:hypothetical protein